MKLNPMNIYCDTGRIFHYSISKVQEIIELAREGGQQCIAECVDDAGSLAHLWQTGVDFIQGNFVQEPCKNIDYDFEGETA